MKKDIKGYLAGMNHDGAKNKENKNSYYSALNFRVVTDIGKSTGSLENERGTKLLFKVPNLPQMTLTNGDVIPTQTNLKIIGWCTIVDTIVIFTTNEDSFTPSNSIGQIWKMEVNEASGDIINLATNGELTITDHLVYNQALNFSTYHRIGRSIGRYETAKIQRVYWTDNYNPVRVFNIAIDDSLNFSLDNIDLQPSISLSQPIIYSIDSGNLPTACEIQFGYRLLDGGGAETLVSPLSALTPLPNENIYSGDYGDFTGNGGPKTKSVTYKIKDLDTDYTTIEHLAILYTAPDVYTVYKFDEQSIPANGEVTVTCSNLDTAIEITNLELNLLSSGFARCKDIEVKDNRLIAANIKTQSLEIDFDARAYRFNTSRNAALSDSINGNAVINGSTLLITSGPGAGTSWTNLIEEHDAINPYNNENSPTWNVSQYKYKANGSTLGGEGPNVSYEFVQKVMPGNFREGITTNPDHVTVNRWDISDGDDALVGQLHGDGSTVTIEKTNQLKNFAAPYNHSYYKGYARGETYRFAIVFWNKKGSTSFVRWIGDIRMPDVEDGFPIGNESGGLSYLYNIGVKFNVNITSIKDQISGYSIVRVKRTEADKTKLGTGLFQLFDRQDQTYETTLLHNWEGSNDGAPGPSNPFQLTNDVDIYGSVDTGPFHLSDKPGFHDPQFVDSASKRYGYLISPIGQLYGVNFSPGDYIRTTGYHRSVCNKYYLNVPTTDPDGDKSYGFSYKTHLFVPYTHSKELYEINNQEVMATGRYYAGGTVLNGFTTDGVMNASYCRETGADKEIPLGIGSPKMIMTLKSAPSINNNTGDPAGTMAWEGGGDYRSLNFGGTDTSGYVLFKEVQYGRYVISQYGGNTFADRSKNEYMSTNHFQIINDTLPNTFNTEVYGGDVFVNYYDDEQIEQYADQASAYAQPYKAPPNPNRVSVAVCFPVESPVNADFREGRTWAADRDAASMGTYQSNQYIYNFIWNQEPIAQEKFFAKDFLLEISEESPHQLWASELKTDGELIDRWRIFKPANRTEVNGIYGPINRIITYKDRLFFYQDAAVGIASLNERSLITDQSGQQAVLGTGGIFPYYNYLSTITGSYHQFCIIPTESGLYHYDARLRKVFKTTGGVMPLSDMKGMSAFFDNNITGIINKEDYTLRNIDGGPTGIHGEADYRYNRVLFTFLKPFFTLDVDNPQDFFKGNVILNNNIYYEVTQDFTYDFSIEPDITTYDVVIIPNYEPAYTISYNEVLDAFESFYSYRPGLYLQYGRRLLSVSPFAQEEAYTHNEGDFCIFYNQPASISRLTTYLGSSDNMTKIFNNMEYLSEVYDTDGDDIFDETISSFRLRNEYQDTGTISLVNITNIKRRMRTWRYTVPRNSGGSDRIRNPWAELTLEYANSANKRLVLHELMYDYTPTNM